MDDHRARPSGTPVIEGLGLRMAIPVAIVTICAAALLLALGGWGPELCSALRAGYPLCAL
ncbi:MAG: hypothetical protein ACK4U0_15085 [Mesorhizobium sp.]